MSVAFAMLLGCGGEPDGAALPEATALPEAPAVRDAGDIAPAVGARDPSTPACFTFVGDVAPARGVAAELSRRPDDPWAAFPADGAPGTPTPTRADAWIGNLEGTLAEGPCQKDPAYCLGFPAAALDRVAAGPFAAFSLANNHALDHGPAARDATAKALAARGLVALPESDRPTLTTIAGLDLAFVPLNLAGVPAGPALERARLALALARAHTPWVVALPHWGVEGVAALGPGQEATANLLHAWGAALVVGSGAHVPQPAACGPDGATWYGLGNHLFDQLPVATHEGAAVRCCPVDGGLTCTETRTRRTPPSTFPAPTNEAPVTTCSLPAPAPADRAWERHPWKDRFRAVQQFQSIDAWFGLHEAWSDLDGEVGLRPYVFRMTDTGFEELWRGSSLARPLLGARLFPFRGEELLCALHRGDSFLRPDPTTTARVWTVYRWNGFGFRGVDDPDALAVCRAM